MGNELIKAPRSTNLAPQLVQPTCPAGPRCPPAHRARAERLYSQPLPHTRCQARRDSHNPSLRARQKQRVATTSTIRSSPHHYLGCPYVHVAPGARPAHSSHLTSPRCAPCPPARAPLTECRPHPLWYRRAMEYKLEKMHPTNKPRGGNLQARLGSLVTTLSQERESSAVGVWLFNTASG